MPTTTINLNKPMLDFSRDDDAVDGLKPAGTETLGQTLAQMLKVSSDGDCLKHLNWAIDLWANKTIHVDDPDFDYLIKFTKDNKQAWSFAKGQILREMTQQKAAQESKAKA